MLANIIKDESWAGLLSETWDVKKVQNRGKDAATATKIDSMLEYISQCAPNCLYRDITVRAKSLSDVWTLIRNWAGLKTSGCHQQVYYALKRNYDPQGDTTPTDFYFMLCNAKEDCLLKSQRSGGK